MLSGKPARVGLTAAAVLGLALVFGSCSHKASAPNVVLVVIDALRPDFLGCYGFDRPTSPTIDDLASRGILFETAVAHAPWTKTSFATFLTSLYAFQHGVTDWESVLPDTIVTLPEELSSKGYSTAAVINMLGITGDFKVTRGFAKISEAAKRDRNARSTTDDAIGLIKEAPKPFFVLVHYFDAHWPYRPAPKYVDMVRREGDPDPFAPRLAGQGRGGGDPDPTTVEVEKILYSACIRSVDDAVARLETYLTEAGLKDNTILIVTADHGEAFWEHGAGTHGSSLHDEEIRVPLIISYPAKYKEAKRISSLARHVDLMPTVLDLAGTGSTGRWEGTSLRPLVEHGRRGPDRDTVVPQNVALCESSLRKAPGTKCVRTAGAKLIIEPSTGRHEFYDLEKDRGEMTNLWGSGGGEIEDSLMLLLDRVPGSTLSGWRIAFTGEEKGPSFVPPRMAADGGRSGQEEAAGDESRRAGLGSAAAESIVIEVAASLEKGSRVIRVDRITTPGSVAIDVAPDSASLTIRAVPHGLQIVLFDVSPPTASVTFQVTAVGKGAPDVVRAGASGVAPLRKSFTLNPEQASDLPRGFEAARGSLEPGIYLWWLAGQEVMESGRQAPLAPDAAKRLRALGYIQ